MAWFIRRELIAKALARRCIFAFHPRDQCIHRFDIVDAADALAGAPNVPPRLRRRIAAGAEIHFGLVRFGQMIGIETRVRDTAAQVVAVDAAEQRCVDNIFAAAIDEHLLVLGRRIALLGRDEARTEVSKIRAQGARGQYVGAAAHGTRENDGAGIHFTNLFDQGKGAQYAGVSARPRAHCNDAVHALGRRLFGMAQIDDVMKHDTAIAMHGGDHFRWRPQTRDDDGDFVFHTQGNVLFQAIVAAVHDLVDRVGRDLCLWIGLLKCRQFLADLGKPFIKLRGRPCIQCWEGAHDAGLALCQDQAWSRYDEHGRADDGQSQAIAQKVGDWHLWGLSQLGFRWTVWHYGALGRTPTLQWDIKLKHLVLALTALAAAATPLTSLADQPPLIDRNLFYGEVVIAGAQVSPDGRYLL